MGRFREMIMGKFDKVNREVLASMTKDEFEQQRKEFLKLAEGDIFLEVQKATANRHIGLEEFYNSLGWKKGVFGLSHVALQEMYMLYCFWRSGKKIYDVHANLARRFEVSHIKEVPIELLRLPFETIQLLIPDKTLVFSADGNRMTYVREITTTISDSPDGGLNMMIFHRTHDDVGFFRIALKENEVQKCVETSFDDMVKNDRYWINEGQSSFTETQRTELRAMFDFTLKSILYITGANSDVEWTDDRTSLIVQIKRAKSNGKIKELGRRLERAKTYYKVGHKIILSREERQMYEGVARGLWKMSYRFIVQGHFRHQAYGPKHSERKLIFIEPFWKGPEFSEIINSQHIIK
jgi:hypothetical protein